MFDRIKNKIQNMIKNQKLKNRLLEKNISISDTARVPYSVLDHAGEGCKFIGQLDISGNVSIGRFSTINGPSTRLYASINSIEIGSFCSIASGVVIQEYYHEFDRITTYYVNQNIFNETNKRDTFSKGSIVIEDDVWIGANVVILSGVTIGRGSIIGAGSIVTKDIPKYSVAVGNPAKIIKKRFNIDTIEYLENLKWWKWSVEEIKKNKKLFQFKLNDLGKENV